MALKIRLRQQGCSNRQTFRVVVSDVRAKRDGKYVEKVRLVPTRNEAKQLHN
jgi:small subunit ribosomal protein S16